MVNEQLPISEIAELEKLRGSVVIVYCGSDRAPKTLDPGDLRAFFGVLQTYGRPGSLDLILHTEGGSVSAGRGFALQLRESADRVNILVPYKARSVGTLVCLAADELILGSMAELSPIDPLIRAEGNASASMPGKISSEDVRCFRAMAETWFDLHSEESRLNVFNLLNQRFFPTTLSAFFRADQYIRKVAQELLIFQLPQLSREERDKIVDRLVVGYSHHHDPINRQDILELGLRARKAERSESVLLDRILTACQRYMNSFPLGSGGPKRRCRALFFGRLGGIQFVKTGGKRRRRQEVLEGKGPGEGSLPPRLRGGWEDITSG
jgi:hypothetical protein